MESIIKEMWHGNIIPGEDSRTNSKEMKEPLRYMSQEEGYAARGEVCKTVPLRYKFKPTSPRDADTAKSLFLEVCSVPAVCEPFGFGHSDCGNKNRSTR